jgi:hypothetical protein
MIRKLLGFAVAVVVIGVAATAFSQDMEVKALNTGDRTVLKTMAMLPENPACPPIAVPPALYQYLFSFTPVEAKGTWEFWGDKTMYGISFLPTPITDANSPRKFNFYGLFGKAADNDNVFAVAVAADPHNATIFLERIAENLGKPGTEGNIHFKVDLRGQGQPVIEWITEAPPAIPAMPVGSVLIDISKPAGGNPNK